MLLYLLIASLALFSARSLAGQDEHSVWALGWVGISGCVLNEGMLINAQVTEALPSSDPSSRSIQLGEREGCYRKT